MNAQSMIQFGPPQFLHCHAREFIAQTREAGRLVKLQPYALPSGDQDSSERMRHFLLAMLGRHMVIKVGQRNVPYAEVAHRRADTIEFRRRESIWDRWREKRIEIDAGTHRPCLARGNACWQISGELKNEADRLFGRYEWTIYAHQIEVDFPC